MSILSVNRVCTLIGSYSQLTLFSFFFKQKTAYEMRISDWSSDVSSSDLLALDTHEGRRRGRLVELAHLVREYVEQVGEQIGDRRVDRDLGHAFGQPVLGARLEQEAGDHVAVALPAAPSGGADHFTLFLEIIQPKGIRRIVDMEHPPGALNAGSEEQTPE